MLTSLQRVITWNVTLVISFEQHLTQKGPTRMPVWDVYKGHLRNRSLIKSGKTFGKGLIITIKVLPEVTTVENYCTQMF
jgi:hypothetical protein